MSKTIIFCLTFLLIGVFAATDIAQAQTLTISPKNQDTYNDWEPTNGGTLTFTVNVSNLSAANITGGKISFDFETVSRWHGICMNDGECKAPEDPDLYFDSTQTTYTAPRWQQSSESSDSSTSPRVDAVWNSSDNLNNFSIDVKVLCRDYGAFGILRVKLYKSTSSSSYVFVKEVGIVIPKDDNGNYMADKSDTKYGYTNPAIDAESGPDDGSGVEENNNYGDGLVEFEEYRGAMIDGVHKRLKPTEKDIFVYSQFTTLGIGDASNLPSTTFKVHEIRIRETKDEDDDRTVNYNSLGTPTQFGAVDAWRVQNTKALWITPTSSGTYLGIVSAVAAPPDVESVKINETNIRNYLTSIQNGTPRTNLTANQFIRFVIGHEMGHGVAVNHPWHTPVPSGSSNPPVDGGWYGFSGNLSHIRTPSIVAALLSHFDSYWNVNTAPAKWTIPVNSYTDDLPLDSSASSFKYQYGSTIMDYPIPFSDITDANNNTIDREGIFPASTFHSLHNWEYQLLGDGVASQETAEWTRRTVSADPSSEANFGDSANSGNGDSTDGSNGGSTETNGDSTETNGDSTETNGGSTETNGDSTETNGDSTETTSDGTETNGGGTSTTPPGAPRDLLVSSEGDGQVSLSWTAPTDTGSSSIDNYEYQYSESSPESWSGWISTGNDGNSITGTSVDVTGLTNDTEYKFQVRAVSSAGESPESDTVTGSPQAPVIITVPAAPAWSDIPDPYNLTVGDYFCLDLSSYVSGSPTIARTLGRIPAGLSLSNGVLSGTVTTVETRYLKFTATNLGGSVQSEWVDIVVTAASTPTVTVPVWSDIPDPYNLIVGDYFSLDLNSYVSGSLTITKNAGAIPAGLSLSNGVLSGTVTTVESRGLQFTATNTEGSAQSEWVQIVVTAASTPTVTAPVWSDIPDPYTLTVGDYFSLDLNSYVTGSLTITKNAGAIPAGLSLSNGILNGTVTTVEDRSIQFTATNSAGSAQSEWVNITVQAAQ